jgi:hypothetical protein
MNMRHQFNEKKLREAIVLVSELCAQDATFGATKLNKILFFIDFRSQVRRGKPLTGAEYQKLEHGPAPRQLLPTRKALADEGAITVKFVDVGRARPQERVVALRPATLGVFDETEIEIIREVTSDLCGMTGSQVSEMSHLLNCWELAAMKETIPYEAMLVDDDPSPMDSAQAARFNELIAEYSRA